MIRVYSRCPINHQFEIINRKTQQEEVHVIKGTNLHKVPQKDPHALIYPPGADYPMVTEMEKETFEAIKDKYKTHVKFFGGVDHRGIKHDALIYEAGSETEADKRSKDFKPIFDERHIATKTPGIEKLKEKDR